MKRKLKYGQSFLSNLILNLIVCFVIVGCQYEINKHWYDGLDQLEYVQKDRIGHAYIKVFLLEDELERFKTSSPENDTSAFEQSVIAKIDEFRTTFDAIVSFPGDTASRQPPSEIAKKFLPDVVSVDFSSDLTAESSNGRRLDDDVFDLMLELTLGRDAIDDSVPTNKDELETFNEEKEEGIRQPEVNISFNQEFPYLNPPSKE